MQTIDIIEALTVIKWLFGVVVVLITFIGFIGGYFLKKIHNTIISDHETVTKDHEIIKTIKPMVFDHEKRLTKLITEHDFRHNG